MAWPEENARVNYPLLKKALCFIKEQEIFDWEDPLFSFAVSWVTLHVVHWARWEKMEAPDWSRANE